MAYEVPENINDGEHWMMPRINLKKALDNVCTYTVGSIPCPHHWGKHCYKCCINAEEDEEAPLLPEQDVDKIRRELKFHFMNPFQRWRDKDSRKCLPRYPFSLCCQILAICLVTTQAILFADSRTELAQFILDNKDAINSLFLDFGRDDSKVVYSMDELYHQIQRVADTYYNIQALAVAPYRYTENGMCNATDTSDPPLLVVQIETMKTQFDVNCTNIDLSKDNKTIMIPLHNTEKLKGSYSARSQLQPYVNPSSIGSIRNLSVHFQLTSFFKFTHQQSNYCAIFNISIEFVNAAVSGAIPVEVTVGPNFTKVDDVLEDFAALDICILITMIAYTFLCLCSIIAICRLSWRTFVYFRSKNKLLNWGHIMSLQNIWLYVMIVGNSLVIAGTALKMYLESRCVVLSVKLEDCTALILGLGVFCQWCGLLHYLSYFESYNILLRIIRKASPDVMRLAVCTIILYFAFLFLGWLVLGPYHRKFADLSITSECLFSLLNGDDIYTTYIEMQQLPRPLQILSQIYLYVFIVFFIYVVLSVFIGLITVTYETLIEHRQSQPKLFLYDFAQNGLTAMLPEAGQPRHATRMSSSLPMPA